ncbi:DUF2521 family protein [Oikeobacillus pervagus]|uniref:DUF2521 family protein n=1 Tax=Oikeobacillus pervagus TaxID=1325931 RepID=UPI0027D82F3D|nr:DUF2521 family protein [Oikeobacillus pervagus]
MDNVITSFETKQREKQIKNERRLLKEISIKSLKKSVQDHFGNIKINGGMLMDEGFDEACFDVAIEAFLLGGHFSKFGYYGEEVVYVRDRCSNEIHHLTDTLYNFWLYWSRMGFTNSVNDESILYKCEHFVSQWWEEGFEKGKLRRKLRLQ